MRARPVMALLILIGLLTIMAPHSQAAGDETPADEWVEAQYSISFVAFDHLWISAMMDVFEADLGLGGGTSAHDIREISKDNDTILDELLDHVQQGLITTIRGSFEALDLDNATISVVMMDRLSFGDDVPGDPYREPLSFQGIVDVALGPSALGLPPESDPDELVMGALQMGGSLNLGFKLRARAGHLINYRFTPPTGVDLMAGQARTNVVELPVDARNETTDLQVDGGLVFVDEDPTELEEKMSARAVIDVTELDEVLVSVNLTIGVVDAVEVSSHFPDRIGLGLISADGIRMAVMNGLVTWDDIYKLVVEDRVRAIEPQISEFMEGDVRLGFEWVTGTQTGYDVGVMRGDPIRATLSCNGSLDLFGWSAQVAGAALDSGAKVPFKVGIDTDIDWSVELVLPRGLTMEGTGLTPTTGTDGRISFSWSRGYGTISGFLVSERAEEEPGYGLITLTIEVKGADTDIGRLLGQRTTTVDFKIGVRVDIKSVPVVGNLSSKVPFEVHMLYAGADFIRAVIDEGILDRAYVDEALENIRPDLNMRVSSVVGTDVDMHLYLEERTLDINSTGSIKVQGSAKVSKDKDIDSLESVANIIEVGQKFPLQGKWNWDVAYIIKMPEGVEIIKVERDLPDTYLVQPIKVSKDKRAFVEVLDGDVMDNVTIFARPTLGLTLSEALPQPLCFVPIVLVVVTLVAVPYWFLRRKRLARARTCTRKGESIDDYRKERVKGATRTEPLRRPLPRRREDDVPTLRMEGERPRSRPSRPPETKVARPASIVHKKNVVCPKCGRRFAIDPRFSAITCPHCGHKGNIRAKKEYKKVMCPRCKHAIRYTKGDTVIKCGHCGKEGRVRPKS